MAANSGKRRFPVQMRHTDFFLQLAHLESFLGIKIEFNRTPVKTDEEIHIVAQRCRYTTLAKGGKDSGR
jgi:hypothetical protein